MKYLAILLLVLISNYSYAVVELYSTNKSDNHLLLAKMRGAELFPNDLICITHEGYCVHCGHLFRKHISRYLKDIFISQYKHNDDIENEYKYKTKFKGNLEQIRSDLVSYGWMDADYTDNLKGSEHEILGNAIMTASDNGFGYFGYLKHMRSKEAKTGECAYLFESAWE